MRVSTIIKASAVPSASPFEIQIGKAHRIGDVRETEHRFVAHARERVEGGGFHLDRKHALGPRHFDCSGSFWMRVGRPARQDVRVLPQSAQRRPCSLDETGIGFGKCVRDSIVIAGALIAQRAVDDDKIGWLSGGYDLASRGQADQELAPAGKKFFSATRTANGAPTAQPIIPTVLPASLKV